ncbi:HSPB1-associated protein 1 isoform X4 [Dendrobates tinctorius]|uniref:HSPB1-associated protein 1 isoform X4 n=1 Tax=Dendrobates tinctorius TaxID=92724 RepID=UPI003CC9ACFD
MAPGERRTRCERPQTRKVQGRSHNTVYGVWRELRSCVRCIQAANIKPFTPEEARDLIFGATCPAVVLGMTDDWPAARWTFPRLCDVLRDQMLRFRIGERKVEKEPQFETRCDYVDATIAQFQDWVSGISEKASGPFGQFDGAESWAYADYKYLALLFKDRPDMLQKWHLFPPEDTACLYPTRIPYEESSVFSKVNVVNPDRQRHPAFSRARPHVVTLHPGQVLVVPRRWWHYVESVDDVTVSVNTWLELDSDHAARVEEAITRTVVCAFKSAEGAESSGDWLNPTEDEATTHKTNLEYLNMAVSAFTEHRMAENAANKDEPEIKRRREEKARPGRSSSRSPIHQCFVPVLPSITNEEPGEKEVKRPRLAGERGAITSDELLDCLLHPRVVTMVAQLLVNRM